MTTRGWGRNTWSSGPWGEGDVITIPSPQGPELQVPRPHPLVAIDYSLSKRKDAGCSR